MATGLLAEADSMSALAAEVSQASDNLDQSARNQAAVVDGAGASISEMSSAINANAENAKTVEDLMGRTESDVQAGFAAIQHMTSAMSEINASSQEIGKILKTIEDISFQTNLLALNAAVEAARAGEAGKGFAVVADDVRNLAQRSAASVKESEVQIKETATRVKRGAAIVDELEQKFNVIMESMTQVAEMVKKIGESTYEQTHGVEHVNQAMAQVDKNTAETTNKAQTMTQISANINERVDSLRSSIGELGRVLNKRIAAGVPEVADVTGRVRAAPARRQPQRPKLPYGG